MVKLFPPLRTPLFHIILAFSELGRVTAVGGETSLSVTSLPKKKWLIVLIWVSPQTSAMTNRVRFNNDSASDYSYRQSNNGGVDATTASTSGIQLSNATQVAPTFNV